MRQPFIRHHFQPHRRDAARVGAKLQIIRVSLGNIAAGEDRVVRLHREQGHVRFRLERSERRPVDGARTFTFQPFSETFSDDLLAACCNRALVRNRRTEADARTTDDVLSAVLVIELHDEARAAGEARRLVKGERRRVRRVQLLALLLNSPARVRLSVERVGHGKFLLRHVRSGRGDLHGPGFVWRILRRRRHSDLGEHEVAVLRAARAFAGQRVVGQRFETQRINVREIGFEDNRVAVLVRSLAGEESRTIVEQLRLLAAGRGGTDELRRLPDVALQRKPVRQVGEKLRRLLYIRALLLSRIRLRQIQVRLVGVIEERHHLVVLTMLDRIVFVRVTLRAADRQPQPRRAGRANPIGHGMETKLQRIDAAFLV